VRIVVTRDFSGLIKVACAFASAVASAATVSLERGIGIRRLENVKAHGARFRALGPHAMSDRFVGVSRINN
jgi:hypothetical protein